MSDKRKVVIDCDPGIDDCFALMMCIKHLDVQGIVAVGGNTGLKYTERNARYMTELTGRPDIPVYAGYDMPMINKPVRAAWELCPSRSRRSNWRSSTAWIIWWTRL